MSKSRGNVITPDDYIETVGADVLRCGLLFSAPWDQGGEFTDAAVAGIERFFAKTWRAINGPKGDGPDDATIARTTAAVTDAIERMAFNVGLARLMELVGDVRSLEAKRVFVRLLAPFAPHLAEELWHQLGEPYSVHEQAWPEFPADLLAADTVEIAVQVDGRLRGTVEVPADADEAAVLAIARLEVPAVAAAISVRVIYVPGRVYNVVTRRE